MTRAVVTITTTELNKVRQFAQLNGVGVATLMREWTEGFVGDTTLLDLHGDPPEMIEVQVAMPTELREIAQRKALAQGTTLRDVIRREIAALDDL